MLRSLFCLLLLLPAKAIACEGQVACALGARSYHVLPPDGWDGQTSLPVLLHFHGWKRQGDLVVKHDRIASATRKRGVLLLAPNGAARTWDFRRADTPDVAFAAAVIQDAAKRYPIDRERIYVSGYSYGSAMAWRYVCQNGNDVAALLAVAGSLPQDETCPQKPAQVRHVHGLTDNVMGFPMGPEGDVTHPVALWREAYECKGAAAVSEWDITENDQFQRYEWGGKPFCAKGGSVILDLHSRGHFIPRGWIARQLDQLLGLPPSFP